MTDKIEDPPILEMAAGVGGFDLDQCPIARAIEILGQPSVLLTVRALAFFSPATFTKLLLETGLPRATLSVTLKRMIDARLVEKRAHKSKDRRERHVYRLAKRGRALRPVLVELMAWSHSHAKETGWICRIIEGYHVKGLTVQTNKFDKPSYSSKILTVVRMPDALIQKIENDNRFKRDEKLNNEYNPWLKPTYYYGDNYKYVDPYAGQLRPNADRLGPDVRQFYRPDASFNMDYVALFQRPVARQD